MISCDLQGGLGNMLFQIATIHSLALDNNDTYCIDIDSHRCLNQGNSALSYKTNIFSKLNNSKINGELYVDTSSVYKPITYKHNLKIHGYFQSELYFKYNRFSILNLFSETEDISCYINKKYKDRLLPNSVSLHVRRGDYLRYSHAHPILPMSYYEKALSSIQNYSKIFVFSDDINWCKSNLKFGNMMFIEGELDFIELYIMSRCNHNIIANSSFSWWAAWLNQHDDKKVIAPSRWFGNNSANDILPIEWSKI